MLRGRRKGVQILPTLYLFLMRLNRCNLKTSEQSRYPQKFEKQNHSRYSVMLTRRFWTCSTEYSVISVTLCSLFKQEPTYRWFSTLCPKNRENIPLKSVADSGFDWESPNFPRRPLRRRVTKDERTDNLGGLLNRKQGLFSCETDYKDTNRHDRKGEKEKIR